MGKKKSNIRKNIKKNAPAPEKKNLEQASETKAVEPQLKKIMWGYKPDIVKKMNEDKPYPEVLHAQFPKGEIKRQMKEKHPTVKCFEIPIVFKNEFHHECLSEDYYCECKDEIVEFIKKTYDIIDDEEDLCDIFDPSMMEPNNEFNPNDGQACVDLRNWVYTNENQPTIPTIENKNKPSCSKCEKEHCDLATCDVCDKRICYYCRYDGYVGDVWVVVFCYECHPELKEKKG